MEKKKKITTLDSILATLCIVISMEAITPTAASGNSQFFYWIVILVLFFIPYSLVSTELGTTFPSDYGIYAWVRKAFGRNMAVRTAWYYWINFPIWMLSFAILFAELANILLGGILSLWAIILIEILFVLVVCYLGTKRVTKLDDLIDVGAIFKLLIFGGLIVLGIFSFMEFGSATDFAPSTFKPSFDFQSLSVIALLIFNFTGLEIVSTYQEDMTNVKKQLPKTIFYSCIIIIVFYILPIISMKVAIPSSDINASTGIIDSYRILLSNFNVSPVLSDIVIFTVVCMFMYILVAMIISWTFGVNSVVRQAALDEEYPEFITAVNKDDVPTNISWINALIAIAMCLFVNLSPGLGENVFMTVFSTSVIVYICSYIPLFATFYKLRKIDKKKRVYEVPGKGIGLVLVSVVPTIILLIGIFFLLFPENNKVMFSYQWPIIVTFVIIVLIGEILVKMRRVK